MSALALPGSANAQQVSEPKLTAQAVPDILAIAKIQARLVPIAERISASPDKADSSLGGIYLDPEGSAIKVYWKGEPPPSLIDEKIAAKAQSITIDIAQALHSKQELAGEVRRLAKIEAPGVGIATSARIETLAPRYDGSGIEVGLSGLPLDYRLNPAQLLPGLTSSIPLKIETAEPATPAARYNDRSPFSGGALIKRGTTNVNCTSGFSVVNQANNAQYILTANHCGNTSDWRTGDNTPLGYTSGYAVSWDAMLIKVPLSSNLIWDGCYVGDLTCNFTKPVIGSSSNFAGMYTCNSGANSGAICYNRVVSTGGVINVTNYGQVVDIVTADNINNSSAGGNGDSGGPQFLLNSDTSKVYALGTLTAVPGGSTYTVPCTGEPTAPNRACARRIYYPDITRQMSTLRDVTGLTGLQIKV